MKKRKISKKQNIIEEEIEDVEKWVLARRKFFIRLAWAVVFVVFLFIVGTIIDNTLV